VPIPGKNSTPNALKLTFFSSKIEKKFLGKGTAPPQMPPHSPPPSAPSILWRSTSAPSVPRLSPRPPDFAPPISTHLPQPMSTAKQPWSKSSKERKFQGRKRPGSERARERNGQERSKSARERFGQGANQPGSYWPIRSPATRRFAPGNELAQERITKKLGT